MEARLLEANVFNVVIGVQGLPFAEEEGLPPSLLMNHKDPGKLQSEPAKERGSQS